MPRLVVAGLSGGAGKTLVTLGLLLAARRRGIETGVFKKGPDYIDAAWLSWASGHPTHNLDTFLMGSDGAAAAFRRYAFPGAINVIEGNRGLYDGFDAQGTHSTAELAKVLAAPVVLVLDATKVTRTAAAMVLGCQHLDCQVNLAAVILNRVSGTRHEKVLRESIEGACGIPVLGAIPKLSGAHLVPERHLGLVVPEDYPDDEALRATLDQAVEKSLDFDRLWAIARRAPEVTHAAPLAATSADGTGLKIAYLRDSAFSFYYPENLDSLRAVGAELLPVPALTAGDLPQDFSALYVGGGFPEVHAEALAANGSFLAALRNAAERGLPIYAECGGLMLLSRGIIWEGRRHAMAGVLPFEVRVTGHPQGHGYVELKVDAENAFFPVGSTLRGHEFHYSAIAGEFALPPTACEVRRGVGCGAGRDAIVAGNLWASYTHLHALGTPQWAAGLLNAARRYAGGTCAAPS